MPSPLSHWSMRAFRSAVKRRTSARSNVVIAFSFLPRLTGYLSTRCNDSYIELAKQLPDYLAYLDTDRCKELTQTEQPRFAFPVDSPSTSLYALRAQNHRIRTSISPRQSLISL